MLGFIKACLVCGIDTTNESRCDVHQSELLARLKAESDRRRVGTRPSNTAQGRDAAWQRLSRRARKAQGYCSDCGTTRDLTADHLPSAWHKRLVLHVPLTLADVDVLCRACNNRRGSSLPGSARYVQWMTVQQVPA